MSNFIPTLFWVTGLSGAGKSTLGHSLTNALRGRGYPVVYLDGDTLREVYGNGFAHDRAGRLDASMHYARLCNMLIQQQVHVVCATISLFHHTQNWNRENTKNYIEIFIDVPIAELMQRDSKKIYSQAKLGELKNVVGIDIQPEFPKKPDLVIKNQSINFMEGHVDLILKNYDKKILLKERVNATNVELY